MTDLEIALGQRDAALRQRDALVAAGQKVLDGLNHRMDHAASVKAPVPVFDGIAELHCALASIKEHSK